VAWDGREYPYRLGLANGTASGPVPGLVAWPGTQALAIRAGGRQVTALYAGGCRFAIEGSTVLAEYDGGAPAAVETRLGKGRVVLIGVHPELTGGDGDLLAGWADGMAPGDGSWFVSLLQRLAR
jgi:hypothetical protein